MTIEFEGRTPKPKKSRAQIWHESSVQGCWFEKWCAERFRLLPSKATLYRWEAYGVTRKKWKTARTAFDLYSPDDDVDVECKSTCIPKTFRAWVRGKVRWCGVSPPQKHGKHFFVIVGFVQGKKVLEYAFLDIERRGCEERVTLRHQYSKSASNRG